MLKSSKPREIFSFKTKSWKKSFESSQSSAVHPQPFCNSSKVINLSSLSTKMKYKESKKLKSQKLLISKTLTLNQLIWFWTLLRVSSFTSFVCLFATDTTCQKRQADTWFQSWWNTLPTARQILLSALVCLRLALKEKQSLKKASLARSSFIQSWRTWTQNFWRLRFQQMRMRIRRKIHWEHTLYRV